MASLSEVFRMKKQIEVCVCYLGLNHSRPLVPQVLQSRCNINLLGTCHTHTNKKHTHIRWLLDCVQSAKIIQLTSVNLVFYTDSL